ncbi:MAG: HAD-IIIA family hydrolase [Gammaproteobacteria bacterium]|nr:HAD-IIIA family hydrolase [Gammaproteobacteria bacterium]MDH4315151.1 HAD-IIIA family hydrolase [Gammaproteobacteria bacterium]MDH5213604.1 HAD-IIIA family hydrolase [Gammaproteobacteria bacterium]MDH5501592.1 HAD-IIIA family hydrolase [Gammaproteobacteria bacterium]
MSKPSKKKAADFSDIRLLGFDIDGVFTDGRFYLSDDGVESKAFNTQDGFGIRRLLSAGIHVAVISGRRSAAVEKRMQELDIAHVILGCPDKVAAFDALRQSLQLSWSQCGYVGDDVPDLPLLRQVGFAGAVANAVEEVRRKCDYVTAAHGGHGAVREVCDLVFGASNRR